MDFPPTFCKANGAHGGRERCFILTRYSRLKAGPAMASKYTWDKLQKHRNLSARDWDAGANTVVANLLKEYSRTHGLVSYGDAVSYEILRCMEWDQPPQSTRHECH